MERIFYRIKAVLEFDEEEKRIIKRFGKSSTGNIERTFCVDGSMPLISLHYCLTKAFGFINEHLHCFQLEDEDFNLLNPDISSWRKNVGKWFKSPLRDENEDFWCDDYKSGSFNNWRKKKYTYPYPKYKGLYNNYEEWQDNLNSYIDECHDKFLITEADEKYHILNVIPLEWIDLKDWGEKKRYVTNFDNIPMDIIHYLFEGGIKELLDTLTVEDIYQTFKRLVYYYDYGDNWTIKLEIEEEHDTFILEQAYNSKIPVLISYEGYNMVEDVGSTYGYVSFLLTLFNLKEVNVEDISEDVISLDSGFYKWIDPEYKSNNIDLSPNRIYGWANGLEWDYHLRYIEDWFK